MSRIHNFSAGPSFLPEDVVRQVQASLWDYNGSGLGIAEMSHRSALFQSVVDSALSNLRSLLKLADDQEILLLHGGAQTQFYQVPMNLLRGGRATYLDTGQWSKKAIVEAKRFGTVDVPWSSADTSFDRVPRPGAWGELPEGTVYLHYTSNNTVAGTQYDYVPEAGTAALICDVSSDILSRPMEGSRFDLLFAGAQKNIGISGVTLVVVRRELLERCDQDIPTLLRYGEQARRGSMVNTPCTLAMYVLEVMTRWILEQGGVDAIWRRNQEKAGRLYRTIDESDLYRGLAQRDSRSWMNISFSTGNPELDTRFWQSAAEEGLIGLKGHRSVGGLRASMYNAQPLKSLEALIAFMEEFERTSG